MKSKYLHGGDSITRYHVHRVSKYIVVFDGNFVCVFSATDGDLPLIRHFHLSDVVNGPRAICPLTSCDTEKAGGCKLYVAGADGQLSVVCALTKREVRKIFKGAHSSSDSPPNKKARRNAHGACITAIHETSRKKKNKDTETGSLLAVGFDDGMVSLIDPAESENGNNNSSEDQWKADDSEISCLSLSHSCENLLTGSSSAVKLWSCSTREILHTFNHFTSPIQSLLCIDDPSHQGDKLVLSASQADNYFVAWNSQSEQSTNFALSSNCIQLSASSTSVLTYPLYVCCCNADGHAQLFTVNVNGKVAKSCLTIRISDSDDKSTSIPVVSCVFLKSESAVVLLYGAAPNLKSEKVPLKGTSDSGGSVINLRRRDPRKLSATIAQSKLSQRTPATANAKKTTAAKLTPKSHAPKEADPSLMDLLEQELKSDEKNLESVQREAVEKFPSSDTPGGSQSILLTQALSSDDTDTLHRIYRSRQTHFIRATVKSLKGPQAYILFKDLCARTERSPSEDCYVSWLKEVVSIHMHYLQSCSGIEGYFAKVNKLTEQEKRFRDRIREVTAKIDVVLSRSTTEVAGENHPAASGAVFQDAETDDEDEVGKKHDDLDDDSEEAAGYFSMDDESDEDTAVDAEISL